MKNDDVSTNITLENFLIMRAQIWSTFESIDDLINNILTYLTPLFLKKILDNLNLSIKNPPL